MGLATVAIGSLPSDPAVAYADHYISADYSDPTSLGVVAGQVDYLVPTCNDSSYLACVKVASDLGLPGHDAFATAQVISHKGRFREWGLQHSIPMPESFYIGQQSALTEALSPSLSPGKSYLVKPTDSHTGLGITRVNDAESLPAAVLHARATSKSASFLIEEEVHGQLLSTSLFLSDGKPAAHFVVDEFCVRYPYAVDESNHPSMLPSAAREAAMANSLQVAAELELVDGLLHTQMITDGAHVWVIETMRRCPGDFYGTLVQLSTDFPYYEHYVAPFVGWKRSPIPVADHSAATFVHRQTISTPNPGFFEGINFGPFSETVMFYPLARSGDETAPLPYGKVGVAFVQLGQSVDSTGNSHGDLHSSQATTVDWGLSCYE